MSLEERSPATPEETEVPLEGAKAEQRVAGEAERGVECWEVEPREPDSVEAKGSAEGRGEAEAAAEDLAPEGRETAEAAATAPEIRD